MHYIVFVVAFNQYLYFVTWELIYIVADVFQWPQRTVSFSKYSNTAPKAALQIFSQTLIFFNHMRFLVLTVGFLMLFSYFFINKILTFSDDTFSCNG